MDGGVVLRVQISGGGGGGSGGGGGGSRNGERLIKGDGRVR